MHLRFHLVEDPEIPIAANQQPGDPTDACAFDIQLAAGETPFC
jgi:hypothetical protein